MKETMSITKTDSLTKSPQDSMDERHQSSQLGTNQIESDDFAPDANISISMPEGQSNKPQRTSVSSCVSEEKSQSLQSSQRLVQNCGPDCMMSQRIVDKLLSRMARIENERSELLAANRSWAIQYKLMKEKYVDQIERLKEEVSHLKSDKKVVIRENEEKKQNRLSTSLLPSDVQNQINMLTHQAEVFKEDFMEERKARAKAHAKLEELKSELKREKKSRSRLVSILQQQNPPTNEKSSPLVG